MSFHSAPPLSARARDTKIKQAIKQVRSDNDASELAILGKFGRLFDEFGAGEGGALNVSDHFHTF